VSCLDLFSSCRLALRRLDSLRLPWWARRGVYSESLACPECLFGVVGSLCSLERSLEGFFLQPLADSVRTPPSCRHGTRGICKCQITRLRPVRLAYQPPASSTFLSEQTSHQQPASSTFLSQQTSTSHQPTEQAGVDPWGRSIPLLLRYQKLVRQAS
jgi:hypothetical protein